MPKPRVIVGLMITTLFATLILAQDTTNVSDSRVRETSAGSMVTGLASTAPSHYVPRYDLFLAPSYLSSPKLNLVQRGFNAQFGVNVKRWLTIGTDYTYLRGSSNLQPQLLTIPLQQMLASVVPVGMQVHVPITPAPILSGPAPR